MLKEIFFAVRDGRGLFYDLLPLRAGGLPVCATAARIAMHAHAMPPATQPAVTRASPITFGCRVLDGQATYGEHHQRAESLSFSEDALHNPAMPAKTADYILTALTHSFT